MGVLETLLAKLFSTAGELAPSVYRCTQMQGLASVITAVILGILSAISTYFLVKVIKAGHANGWRDAYVAGTMLFSIFIMISIPSAIAFLHAGIPMLIEPTGATIKALLGG